MKLLDDNELKKWASIRQFFHSIAELSGEEKKTAKEVVLILKDCFPSELIEMVGGHGVLATFEGAEAGKTILFRAELDALPIKEINTFKYRSIHQGVSHKCGHDGHLTILLALAKHLSNNPLKKGKVMLLFQPSEENGAGAQAVLNDSKFSNIKPDYVFAFHNLPGFPLGQIIYKRNSFTAAVKSMIIKLVGKTAHAGEPENGINPAKAIADIVQKSLSLSNNFSESDQFRLITPIYITMGEKAYGVSAGMGEVHFTIRTWTEETLTILSDTLEKIVDAVSKKYSLNYQIDYIQHFQANKNNNEAIEYLLKAAKSLNYELIENDMPFKWGEDFGVFTQQFKGAMFGIGSGEKSPSLHNPDYNFPDELIPIGMNLFYAIIDKTLF
jgi:amidohydrolase